MNKTAIKNFSIWARNKLISDINYRVGLLGITPDGIRSALPQSTGQTLFYDIGTSEPYAITGEQIQQRQHLVDLLRQKEKETDFKTAYKYVLEEVAYTWFNRLIAVRFMEVNDYLPSHIRVLSSESGKMEPDLVTTPFDANLEFTRDEQQAILDLKNANKLDEVFRLLFIKQCNALNEILPALFEKTSDYTELLLNLSVIDQDGVVWHLVHDIPESDFNVEEGGQVEIIGWLYQYYNTEPKNEAFAKKGKITKDEIPAVTQLFTPDWIVRYMVENSLGRLWVEGHPNEELKSNWKYYLEEAEQEPEVAAQLGEIRKEYAKLNPEDIKVIDPCMGSGHILVYAFDVLMQIYESAGYGQRDAARSILENNIYGLDIDDRAFQMAYFAVMMKARQYNRRILNGEYMPNVYSIQESNGINRKQLKYFGKGLNELEKNNAINQIIGLLDTFIDAKEYGSILNIDPCEWDLLMKFVKNIDEPEQMDLELDGIGETQERLNQIICQGRLLGQKYEVTVTNPPYRGMGDVGEKLQIYAKTIFPDSKQDLSTIFMEKCITLTKTKGFFSMINIPVWMLLTTYSKLRIKLYGNCSIVNLIHIGRGVFGSDFGTVAFTFSANRINEYRSLCKRLFDRAGDVESEDGKIKRFFSNENTFLTKASGYINIPGERLAYWASSTNIEGYKNGKALSYYASVKKGMSTADDNRFLRLWNEVSAPSFNVFSNGNAKWFRLCKGGSFRRWYGNNDYVVNWQDNGRELKSYKKSVIRNPDYYLKSRCLTWTYVTNYKLNVRYTEKSTFAATGPCVFSELLPWEYILGFLNTPVAQLYANNVGGESITYEVGEIASIPVIESKKNQEQIITIVNENVHISKEDWDCFEFSWDFKKHPLAGQVSYILSKDMPVGSEEYKRTWNRIEDAWSKWRDECEKRFSNLKKNEEELNRIFIDIYHLQDELSKEVEDKDITVRLADLQRDIKSLLAYAVGCMLGRYSLDIEGLVYAGGTWDGSNYSLFIPDKDNVIPITDEEYLEDDIVSRLCTWLKVVYGEETLEENLDFIAKALGNKGSSSREIIRNYFLNDFFKDHCQTYSVTSSGKRPIYWLFDSGKQNGFKALIYLHRYNADTIGNLRIDYLHRMQRIYESEINRMQDMIDHSTSARESAQATKRREKLTKQLKECREYDEKLAHLALSRIELDLDDGVKINYRKLQTASDGKFYEVLADSNNIMSKK